MNGTKKKLFFLGIGAAKSGTSWLYDYLTSHPDVAPGPIKEMHVLNDPGNQGFFNAVRNLPWHRFAGRKWLAENLKKAYFRADWDRYYKAYLNILSGDCLATGEISTSYMTIPAVTLSAVKERFGASNVRCYGLLVLRDPVERLISDVRFHKRLSNENRYAKPVNNSLDELVRAAIDSEAETINCHYAMAIRSLNSAFGEMDRSIIFYEELFQQVTLNALCEKMGLSWHSANFGKQVNKTTSTEAVSEATKRQALDRLRPSYAAVAALLGEERLHRHWATGPLGHWATGHF